MFKTFKDHLEEIEQLYNSKDYDGTILESAKLTERALNIFFNKFHTTLQTRADWIRYLQFERENGEKYASFLKKPTIGVAIGYYNRLLELFPNFAGLNPEIRQYLNSINSIRNSHLHSNSKIANSDEAGAILDTVERILSKANLLQASTTSDGIPIKHYLVYKSIKEKFERAESLNDFKKIIGDSSKIIPPFLNILLNKVFPDLVIDKKEKLVDLFAKDGANRRDDLGNYVEHCEAIGLQNIIGRGASLVESLQAVKSDTQENYSRRQTRHYVNVLEIITEYTNNPETNHFLEFADAVKKKYLTNRRLAERDRIILEEKAADFRIPKDLATRIEESVIATIDNELTLFQTLTKEVESGEIGKKVITSPQPELQKPEVKEKSTSVKPPEPVAPKFNIPFSRPGEDRSVSETKERSQNTSNSTNERRVSSETILCPKCGHVLKSQATASTPCPNCNYTGSTISGKPIYAPEDEKRTVMVDSLQPKVNPSEFQSFRFKLVDIASQREIKIESATGEVALNRGSLAPGNQTISSNEHVKMRYSNKRIYIKDVSSNSSTFIQVKTPKPLSHGRRIVLGNKVYSFQPAGEQGAGKVKQLGGLSLSDRNSSSFDLLDESSGKEIRFNSRSVSLNRDNLDPGNKTLSGNAHALIELRGGQWVIEDKSSNETTFVQLTQEELLDMKTKLIIGNTIFQFDAL